MRFRCLLILIALLCGTPAVHSSAAAVKVSFDEKAVAEFYRGKTVRIIVGFSAGGGYDAYSRVIGRHLHKHIPGNPTVVVDNMAGAGSILAANHINNVAPKDGTIIGISAARLFWNSFLPTRPFSTTWRSFEFSACQSEKLTCW